MKNHLILVEGLPCSGKSTLSKYIAELLMKWGNKVSWVDEGTGNHPADYEFQSFITEDEYKNFIDNEKEDILNASIRKKGGYVVELNKLQGELFDKMLQYKIYDFLDWNLEKEIMLDKWQEFVDNADADTIYVFNCCFLQNPMCETMIRFGYDIEISRQYITSIADIIEPMNPLCFYLDTSNIEDRISNTIGERGEDWINSVIEYHTLGEYGKKNALTGYNGYISCLEERKKRELKILEGLNIDKRIIKQAADVWNKPYILFNQSL